MREAGGGSAAGSEIKSILNKWKATRLGNTETASMGLPNEADDHELTEVSISITVSSAEMAFSPT